MAQNATNRVRLTEQQFDDRLVGEDGKRLIPTIEGVGTVQIAQLLGAELRAVRQWATDGRKNPGRIVLGHPWPEEALPKGNNLGECPGSPLWEVDEIKAWGIAVGIIERGV